jgi:hypothetical protein
MASLHDKPRPAHPALAWRQVGDEVMLVDPTQADTVVRVFNDVAGAIWLRLDGQHDLATVVAAIAAEYDAPPAEIQADVLAFVDGLLAKGVLVV